MGTIEKKPGMSKTGFRSLMAGVLALGLSASVLAPQSEACAATTVEPDSMRNVHVTNGYYKFRIAANQQLLDMKDASLDACGEAQVWPNTGSTAQVWKVFYVGMDGEMPYYRISNANSGLVLEASCGGTGNATRVRQYTYNETPAQHWYFYQSDDGRYTVVNRKSDRALDVNVNDPQKSGAGFYTHLWDRNGTEAQLWSLEWQTDSTGEKLAPGIWVGDGDVFKIQSTDSTLLVDIDKSSKDNGGNAQAWGPVDRSNAQVWRARYVKDCGGSKYYKLENANSGKVLDVDSGATHDGANVQQFSYNGSDAQLWKFCRSVYGQKVIVNKKSGKALDIANGVKSSGSNLQIWGVNDSSGQSWELVKSEVYAKSPQAGASAASSSDQAYARQIFDAYNNYRASKGLARVAWSDECAKMAADSAAGCAKNRRLTHLLGIPANLQKQYSDILQYTSWKPSGDNVVSSWRNSSGHRRMMQCESTTKAGVGVYNLNGKWYIALVYDWKSINQNGN